MIHAFPVQMPALVMLTLTVAAVAQTPEQALQARRQALHAAGATAPLTVFPVRLVQQQSQQVAEALGLVLEQLGMTDVEVGAVFSPTADATWDAVPAELQKHVQGLGPAAGRYHLYAEFVGTPHTGPQEVRFVVVDQHGELVWNDRQTPADADFKRTAGRDPDPMGCSTLVAERLFALTAWERAPAAAARTGKFAELWRNKSGAPDKKEFAAMKERVAALRGALATATIAVLPTVAVAGADGESAKRLAQQLGKELGCQVQPAADGATLTVAPSSNEQKRLWDLARGLRAAVAKQPVDADYVLVADIGVHPERGPQWVHAVLCTKAGEIVLADFQNDQHPMFQKAAPKTLEDAEKLAVARLAKLLR